MLTSTLFTFTFSLFTCQLTRQASADFRIFFNLEQALDFFRNDTSTLSDRILYAFENNCCAVDEPTIPRLRKPFIVIEGNNRKSHNIVGMRLAKMMHGRYLVHPAHCLQAFTHQLPKGTRFRRAFYILSLYVLVVGRNIVGMRLAKMMHGRYLVHPAHCLQAFTHQLPKGTRFRRAFYILSLYAISFDVKFHLSLSRAVVVNGYWWDMLIYALIQAFPPGETPTTADPMFNISEGLFHPDMVFYLNFPDNLYQIQVTTRSPTSWKSRMLQIYGELERERHLEIVDLTGVLRATTDLIYGKMMRNLSATRDVWFDPRAAVNFDYSNR